MQAAVERIWQWLGRSNVLLGLLAGLFLLSLLTLFIPQAPFYPHDTANFTRWLADLRSTWGQFTSPLAAVGLFTIRSSWPQRLFLALLSLVVTVRLVELLEQWADLALWHRLHRGAICGGAALLIAGWILQLSAGWVAPEIIVWPAEVIELPAHDLELVAPAAETPFARCGYGLYLLRERRGLGLEVQATKDEAPVNLLASAHGEPQEKLLLSLTERAPDAYFALPEAGFIFRASMLQPPPQPEFRVQIYGEAESELLTETLFQGDGTLFTTDVRLEIVSHAFPELTVVYNPGAPLTGLGWILLAAAGGVWLVDKWVWRSEDDQTEQSNEVVSAEES